MNVPQIPTYSLNDLLDISHRTEISSQCHKFGLFHICIGDDVADRAIQARDSSICLFNRTEESKESALRPKGTYRGYMPLSEFAGDEGGAPPVRYEGFVVGDDMCLDNSASSSAQAINHPNIWPSEFHEQKKPMVDYWNFCQSTSINILDSLISALNVKGIDFDDAFKCSLSNLVFMRYHSDNRSRSMNPKSHTDSSMITLLFFDGVPGLEIFYGGEWVPLECKKDSLMCIVGDSLEAMSGGQYSAVRHRVRSPSGGFRHSAAFFAMPRHDYLINPIAGTPLPKYTFTAGDRFQSYLKEFD